MSHLITALKSERSLHKGLRSGCDGLCCVGERRVAVQRLLFFCPSLSLWDFVSLSPSFYYTHTEKNTDSFSASLSSSQLRIMPNVLAELRSQWFGSSVHLSFNPQFKHVITYCSTLSFFPKQQPSTGIERSRKNKRITVLVRGKTREQRLNMSSICVSSCY